MTKQGKEDAASYILDLFRQEEEQETNYCIVVAGQVNSGKSTLCRQLVNTLLGDDHGTAYPQVAWMDCDSGQPEFTPPCLVSLHLLSTPVLGGPLEHQRSGDVQFFTGDPSPRPDKEYYIQCIFTLFQRYQELARASSVPLPLVINTNGWVKGAGGTMLGRIVQFCQPRMIVQLLKNTNSPTTPDLIDFQAWSPRSGIVSLPAYAATEDHDHGAHEKERASAKRMRDLLIMKYFQCDQTPLASAIPYRVSWSRLRVRFMFSPVAASMALYALNGTVVALCVDSTRYQLAHENHTEEHQRYPSFLSSTPICDCVGFGLIRAIDPDQRSYYIITPVPSEKLMHVNTILKGNVELPTFSLMEGGVMNAPYLCSNSLSASDGTSGITPMSKKRPDLPRRRLAQ